MNFICFDTEDDSKELLQAGKSGFDKQVTQIAARTAEGKRYYNKGDVKDFLRWLQAQKERFVYAHNLQYDLGNLFGRELDRLDVTMVGGRLIKAVWGNKVFVDSFNLWPMSAKSLGEAFGLEKLETENMATDKEYVFRDVDIIRNAMLFVWNFCDQVGLSHCPPTLGGLCVKVWRHWGGENCHDSLDLSKAAYFGGRVELFKPLSDTQTTQWTDINSLYPSVMLGKFPGPIEPTGTEMKSYGVAKVTIQMPETEFAVLPFRDQTGRILYPWGKFTGVWTMAEIIEALASGGKVLKVHEAYTTDETMEPYGAFVDKLYRCRLLSNSEAEKTFFKLLMNNLYGRLGTGGEIARTVWQAERNQNDGICYGEKVLVKYKMPLGEEVNWLHAAYVTAYGRLQLLKFMRELGPERLIYCDTDSTIFDSPNGQVIPFQCGKELGQMKLELFCTACLEKFKPSPKGCCEQPTPSDYWPACAAFAPKQYRIGNLYKAKGVPKKHQKAFIETGHAHYDMPFKFREAVAFYDRKNSKRLSVWRPIDKYNRARYDRKKLVGNRYLPCKINAVE